MQTQPESSRTALDAAYPRALATLPADQAKGGRYIVRFARTTADLTAVKRLRYEVFNLELNEGLDESHLTGLDQDHFDPWCHHLIVELKETGEIVGTYRLQTHSMAERGVGWYTASEFDLTGLPMSVQEAAVEAGRACVAQAHRNGRVLKLLWRGLAIYMLHNHKRYIFGCCSLTSQDPHVARQTYEFLAAGSYIHPSIRTSPLPGFECYPPDFTPDANVSVKLPALFAGYLKLSAKITSEPALDRQFKTIDFLVLIDIADIDIKTYGFYFE